MLLKIIIVLITSYLDTGEAIDLSSFSGLDADKDCK